MRITRTLAAATAFAAGSLTALAAAPVLAHTVESLPAAADGSVYIVTSRQTFDAAGILAREATRWNDRLARELVVARLDPAEMSALSRHVHEVEKRCGGFFAFASRPEAEAFIARDRSAEAIALPLGGLYTVDNQATVGPWLPQVAEANIRATITTLSGFRNRYYASPHGRQAAEWIRDTWQALAANRSDASVALFEDCTDCSTQPSVILTVQGSALPDEIVVVGGHLDSITGGFSGASPDLNQLAPGADDDASGIATMTEIIRISLAGGWKPRRTLKFMAYAAEEVGLRGSRAIANRFRDNAANVVGVLQLDMTNYRQGVNRDLRIVSDFSNTALTAYFGELFDEYLLPLGGVRGALACNYGCSDHASWTSAGFPAGMVFEAGRTQNPGNPWDLGAFQSIHTTGDTLANMGNSAGNSVRFAQFGLAFVGELAKTHGGAANQAPSAGFSHAADRMSVQFTDASSDSDGSIVTRLWDFGDGTTSAAVNPLKTYTTVGSYQVALTVTDDGGLPNNTIVPVPVDNGIVALANGVTANGLAAQEDTQQVFTLDLPGGASELRFVLGGAAGENADLTITRSAQTVCSAQQATAAESCEFSSPSAGLYTATVAARTALSGFTLQAAFVVDADSIFDDGFDPQAP